MAAERAHALHLRRPGQPPSYSYVVSDDLPNGIPEILQYLAQMARGYANHLKWNEVAKLN